MLHKLYPSKDLVIIKSNCICEKCRQMMDSNILNTHKKYCTGPSKIITTEWFTHSELRQKLDLDREKNIWK